MAPETPSECKIMVNPTVREIVGLPVAHTLQGAAWRDEAPLPDTPHDESTQPDTPPDTPDEPTVENGESYVMENSLGSTQFDINDISVQVMLTQMERRKALRRWAGFRSNTSTLSHVGGVLLLYFTPFAIFSMYTVFLPECRHHSRRQGPCELQFINGTILPTDNEVLVGTGTQPYVTMPVSVVNNAVIYLIIIAIILCCSGGHWAFVAFMYAFTIFQVVLVVMEAGCDMSEACDFDDEDWFLSLMGLIAIVLYIYLALLVYSSYHYSYVLPFMAKRSWGRFRDVRSWYRVSLLVASEDDAEEGAALTRGLHEYKFEYYPVSALLVLPFVSYLRPLVRLLFSPAMFSYTGGLDEDRQPHGFGRCA